MAQQNLILGAAPNDGTGEGLRSAMQKVQDNTTELYSAKVAGPGTVTDDLPAVFDGTTGKLLRSKTYAAFKTLLALAKGDVGLGNVDNTADTAKPVSTAQQTALNLKANLASPAFTGTVSMGKATLSYASAANGFNITNTTDMNGTFNTDWGLTEQGSGSSSWYFAGFKSAAGADNEFLFRGDGSAFCDGSWNGGGADYAEYFEWADGNPAGDDRRGYSVVLVDEKIRLATDDDDPAAIIGVVSARPTVVGDAAPMRWKDKYLRDAFGEEIMRDDPFVVWLETVTKRHRGATSKHTVEHAYFADSVPAGITVPKRATRSMRARRVLNSNFDPSTPYVPRELRPEWSPVGLMGKLVVRQGQPHGDRWIKLSAVGDCDRWLVR